MNGLSGIEWGLFRPYGAWASICSQGVALGCDVTAPSGRGIRAALGCVTCSIRDTLRAPSAML